MYNPKMTTYIVDSKDYFAANNADGGVRIGLKGSCIFILKPDHEMTEKIKSAKDEEKVEALFDELRGRGEFFYA